MLCDSVDQDKIDVFPGSSKLYFYMGQVCILFFVPVIKRHSYFVFALRPQLCCQNPFSMKKEFSFCGEANEIVLSQAVQLEEHLVIVIYSVHDESSFLEQGGTAHHCGKGYIIDGGEVLLL